MAQNYDTEYFTSVIRSKLSDKRFRHSLAVSREAAALARLYGADVEKAGFAGLVHDIEKDTPGPEQLQTLEKYSIILDNVEKCSPKLWHAMAGAAVLEHEYGVTDSEVLCAVRYHTTARAGMSLLEKIIYLADYVSEDRDYDGVGELRAVVHRSLEEGLRAAYDFSVTELVGKGAAIHLDTARARNELICSHLTFGK
jgi:predicted HD superfamily hydrolase involved in NAD metabolism